MGQQEYEAFKAKLREWMNTHPDEYAAFEEAMNARDYAGCQSVIFQAMSLIPRYRRLMSDKANEGLFEHVDEIEQAARQHDLAGKIIRECEQPGKDSTLPAMLCWLYFGKSFERMVERCEELRRSSDLGFLQKMTMSATIRLLISRSIKLELRTKQDWDAHREAIRLAESDRVLEWATGTLLVEDAGEKRKPGRPSAARSLVEMFSPIVTHPAELRRKIGEYLTRKHTQTDIARLKIALDELRYLVVPINIKPFRDALQAERFDVGWNYQIAQFIECNLQPCDVGLAVSLREVFADLLPQLVGMCDDRRKHFHQRFGRTRPTGFSLFVGVFGRKSARSPFQHPIAFGQTHCFAVGIPVLLGAQF